MSRRGIPNPYNILYLKDHGLVMFIMPKVASTSIKLALRRSTGVLYDAPKSKWKEWEEPTWRTPQQVLYLPVRKIIFVRNPYTRLLSCYYNKVRSDSTGWKNHGVGDWTSFEEFVNYVTSLPVELADKHFRPYWYDTEYNREFIPTDVVYFEELQRGWEKVQGLSTKIELPSLLVTNKIDNQEDLYDDYTRDRVYEYYRRDFERFGYGR